MKVYRSIEDFKKNGNAIVTIGTFDGVHVGHRKILKRICDLAARQDGESVVLTFDPHPRLVLYGNENLSLITTTEEKIGLIEACRIDHLIIHPFTREFSELSATDFIERMLIDRIGCRTLVVGYDHRFGKGREGSFESVKSNLSRWNFELEEIPRQDVEDIAVSSTKIRRAIGEHGDIQQAEKLLGHDFSLTGQVVGGARNGRKIGFPTANIAISDPYKLIPYNGVYAVKVFLEGSQYGGMMNIGFRPTLNGVGRTIEVHIFDFEADIYGKQITVVPVKRIREEMKFSSLDKLKEQLAKDKEEAQKML